MPRNPQAPKRGPGGLLPQPGAGRVNPPGQGMMNPPGQGPARQARGRSGAAQQGKGIGGGKGAGVGGAALPGPGGRQLAAKLASGAIDKSQAQRTMQQRQTLAKTFGKDFRSKLEVGGKSFADVNKGLKANPGNAKLAALRKRLLENRKSVLEQARQKAGGGDEDE
jgi:hypothetical protein